MGVPAPRTCRVGRRYAATRAALHELPGPKERQDLALAASKHFRSMSDVHVLTESGVTSLSYDAILWLIERATLEFPDGTLDRLDQGLADGVVALNASDLAAISDFFYDQLDAAENPAATRAAPEVSELTAALTDWSRPDRI